jgi:hypothetical protein
LTPASHLYCHFHSPFPFLPHCWTHCSGQKHQQKQLTIAEAPGRVATEAASPQRRSPGASQPSQRGGSQKGQPAAPLRSLCCPVACAGVCSGWQIAASPVEAHATCGHWFVSGAATCVVTSRVQAGGPWAQRRCMVEDSQHCDHVRTHDHMRMQEMAWI